MANISDVAKLANVSVATVSRYIRTPDKVAKKSAVRVADAIQALNYKPNLLARSFSERRSYTILVLAPDITSPFLSELIRGIEEIGMEAGYRIILGEGRMTDNRLQGYLELAESGVVDGAIQLLSSEREELIERQKHIPLVLVGEFDDAPPCATVSINDELAARDITEHLISLGHKRIACLEGFPWLNSTQRRLRGFKAALEANQITFDERYFYSGDYSPESGVEAANKFTKQEQKPTAVMCMNDLMALGMVHGLRSAGLDIPKDISVVGFDDINVIRYTAPPLTTVRQPAKDLGKKSMQILLEQLNEQDPSKRRKESVYLPHELILRSSTGPARSD
jgi:LacI family repressor for deo operon, udp, cdd, tsx, nupC, and nupG